jgi:WD40 repeat protein
MQGFLFSGSNRTIRVWDVSHKLNNTNNDQNDILCVMVIEAHDDYVECLEGWDNILYSASEDKIIRAWDMNLLLSLRKPTAEFNVKKEQCCSEFVGHKKGIACIYICNFLLYSGSYLIRVHHC